MISTVLRRAVLGASRRTQTLSATKISHLAPNVRPQTSNLFDVKAKDFHFQSLPSQFRTSMVSPAGSAARDYAASCESYDGGNSNSVGSTTSSSGGDGLAISELRVSPEIVKALSCRGIEKLLPIQKAVLEPAMQGRDIIGRARAGTGKTLAFGIPVIDKMIKFNAKHGRGKNPLCLVLAPTRELARQVEKEFRESAPSLDTICLYGGTPIGQQMRELNYGVDVAVGTPGRIIDLMKMGSLNLSEVQFVLLDEADQMLQVGFAKDVKVILKKLPKKRQSMMFSATMPSWIRSLAKKYLNNPLTIDLVGDSDQKLAVGISMYSTSADSCGKASTIGPLVEAPGKGGKCIVFTQKKRDADRLSYGLARTFKCEVATDASARGLDVPNVDLDPQVVTASHDSTIKTNCLTPWSSLQQRANERKNKGIDLLGMVKAGMADAAVFVYENMEERCRKLKDHSLSFDHKIIDSVVKVFSATTRHDTYRPWQNRDTLESNGSGFAIFGKRILTCAHVINVSNQCTFIDVQRNNSTIIYKARVTKITHECDLAILEVDNDEFWQDMSALSFGDIPMIGEALTVVGFPKADESHVCNSGLVTEIKFSRYAHSETEHLIIGVDANILSGHSGGPVIMQGKVIGVAFQSYDFEQYQTHIGYVIPTCVVMQFLSSSEESQQLSSLSSLGFTFDHCETGVVIKRISSLSGAHKIMCLYDILLAVDNIAIGYNGRVPFRRRENVDFRYLLSLKKPGESLLIKFLRSGEVLECDVTLKPVTPHIAVQKYYNSPKYYIFGGVVFVAFSKSYIEDLEIKVLPGSLLYETETKAMELEAGELVIISKVLKHDSNRCYEHLVDLQVYNVNGVRVESLKHLVFLIEQCCTEHLILDLQEGEVAILHYSSAKEVTSDIMELYRISKNLIL